MFLHVSHAQHTLSDQPLHRQGTQGPKAAADDPPARGLFRRGQVAGYPDDHLANVLCGRQLAQRIRRLLDGEDNCWQRLYLACKSENLYSNSATRNEVKMLKSISRSQYGDF